MNFSFTNIIVLSLVTCLLSGCGVDNFFTSEVSNNSKTRSSSSDTVIYTNAIRHIQNIRRNLNSQIKVSVLKGRVLVVGYVDSPEQHLKLTTALWGISGVQEVIDHLEYVLEPLRGGFAVSHAVIKAQLQAKLLTQSQVKSSNFQYIFFKDNLYVLACPTSEKEKDLFFDIARTLPQVKKVFFYDMHR